MSPIPLMQIVLDTILFFGLSSDDVVQPDDAVKQLEAIAAEIRKLPLSEKQEFFQFVNVVANSEDKEKANSERVAFMRQIGENLGIAD